MLMIAFLFATLLSPLTQISAKNVVDKKSKKTYKLVESRADLLKEFKSHVFNLDKSFKVYVSSSVVKDFPKEFKGIWKDLSKDSAFNEIWKTNTAYKSQFKDYSHSKAKCWEWNVMEATYSISKEKAKDIVDAFQNPIESKEDLVNEYSSRIIDMKKDFTLLVSKKVMKNFKADYEEMMKKLDRIPEYTEIMKYAKVAESTPYDFNEYWKWDVKVDYLVSNETFDEIGASSAYLASRNEILNDITTYINRLDRRIVLNVDKKVLDFNNAEQYNSLWIFLYNNPEFSDVYSYAKKFKHKIVNHKDYTEWIIDLEYHITEKEVKALDKFITKTVNEKVKPQKSDEAKVKAINDFMTSTYKLNYTSKGKNWFFTDKNSGSAKLGKYNINTAFALFYKKGGSSDGFANMFYRLAKKAGLDVRLIVGKKGENRYSWNMVKINGKWYHISTIHNMDDSEKLDKMYHYLKSDSTMKKTYTWTESAYPSAEKDF